MHFLIPREALNSFMVMNAPVTSRNLLQKYVCDCMRAPFTKITHILTSPAAFLEQFLRAIGHAASRAIVLILPLDESNLTHNSHAVHSFQLIVLKLLFHRLQKNKQEARCVCRPQFSFFFLVCSFLTSEIERSHFWESWF